MKRKKVKLIVAALTLLIVGGVIVYVITRSDSPPIQNTALTPQTPPVPNNSPGSIPTLAAFDKTRYSLDDPTSLWVVVNKKRPLSADFVPKLSPIQGANLQPEAVQALGQLLNASTKANISLRVVSGYRSYPTQKSVYNAYVQKDGQTAADTYSARPGYSEHQTGLATDLGNGNSQCDLDICFATTPGGKWLAANAHTYGFTIRYAEDKTAVTGYQYEPWHIRYVGIDLANQLYSTGQTMEEFFGLPAAPGY